MKLSGRVTQLRYSIMWLKPGGRRDSRSSNRNLFEITRHRVAFKENYFVHYGERLAIFQNAKLRPFKYATRTPPPWFRSAPVIYVSV